MRGLTAWLRSKMAPVQKAAPKKATNAEMVAWLHDPRQPRSVRAAVKAADIELRAEQRHQEILDAIRGAHAPAPVAPLPRAKPVEGMSYERVG